ncbi:MAG TPA: ribonuclease III [Anaerolineae bacterium]|nr:ribonuclease III [Anaerolineae bacterium]HID83735.1 ribonuclease III [Anaerolineales bacterium]HIQ09783.1 ribonuclease III [Anaerolineaceae bacterium]
MLSPQRQGETPYDFARRLGLTFKDPRLLVRALTHRSYLNEHPEALEDNERLEFLGDAVLDFLVGEWLYHHFPEMPEGDLTRLRAALVCRDQLAAFAHQIELHRALLLGHGEEANGGRNRPTTLSAAFEALVGALYLDQGIEAVRRFLLPLLEPAMERILEARLDEDPKSRLQEWAQAQGYRAPTYHILEVRGPDHAREFDIEVRIEGQPYGRGKGPSKREASKSAAADALRKLGLA